MKISKKKLLEVVFALALIPLALLIMPKQAVSAGYPEIGEGVVRVDVEIHYDSGGTVFSHREEVVFHMEETLRVKITMLFRYEVLELPIHSVEVMEKWGEGFTLALHTEYKQKEVVTPLKVEFSAVLEEESPREADVVLRIHEEVDKEALSFILFSVDPQIKAVFNTSLVLIPEGYTIEKMYLDGSATFRRVVGKTKTQTQNSRKLASILLLTAVFLYLTVEVAVPTLKRAVSMRGRRHPDKQKIEGEGD